MTLRAKLLLSTSIQVLLVIFISIFLVDTSRRIGRTTENQLRANQIVEVITQIRFVTFENLLHHDDRSYEQWQSQHDALALLRQPVPMQTTAERAILDTILNDSQDVSDIFTRL